MTKAQRTKIIEKVFKEAMRLNDQATAEACFELMTANSIGWEKHHDKETWMLVELLA